jgi:hypothetical protein
MSAFGGKAGTDMPAAQTAERAVSEWKRSENREVKKSIAIK